MTGKQERQRFVFFQPVGNQEYKRGASPLRTRPVRNVTLTLIRSPRRGRHSSRACCPKWTS